MPPHPRPARRRALAAFAATALAVSLGTVAGSPVAGADPEDPPPTPVVISMGDSYISGEGGRWAGNESLADGGIDTGADAYFDNPDGTAEQIPYCHRSKSAMIHLGSAVRSINLACSGATTASAFDTKNDNHWKPGVDQFDDGKGHLGQAKLLQMNATGKPVKMVVLSIGGNDFNFSDIVTACVESYLTPSWFTKACSKQDSTKAYVGPDRVKAVRGAITRSIGNIRDAMRAAGHADADWTLVVNTYPQVLPYPAGMRYADGTWERQTIGGCGFRDPDLTWALNDVLGTINDTVRNAVADARAASATNRYVIMENSTAFGQRGLCDKNVNRVGHHSAFAPWVDSWKDAGASDASEWVTEINAVNVFAHHKQESLHPNYWGQLALRNCLRQVWNGGAVRGGTCVRSGQGINERGEPNVALRGLLTSPVPVAIADRFAVLAGPEPVSPGNVLHQDVDHPTSIAPLPATDGETVVIPAEGGGLSARLVTGTTNGTVELTADGSFAYTPAPGFTGTDSFTYVAQDFFGASEPATVTLEVSAASGSAPTPARPVQASPSFTG